MSVLMNEEYLLDSSLDIFVATVIPLNILVIGFLYPTVKCD